MLLIFKDIKSCLSFYPIIPPFSKGGIGRIFKRKSFIKSPLPPLFQRGVELINYWNGVLYELSRLG